MPQPEFVPARIHVLLARDAPYGVVVRRGPSKSVCVLGWNRDTDVFTIGQWLRGRIYPLRCDLSPDGKHLIYFAMNGRWEDESKGSWTALSRAPYLKALGFWPWGHCWYGGGLFVDSRRYWLNGTPTETTREPHDLHRIPNYPNWQSYGGEDPGVYLIRLKRDGWEFKGLQKSVRHSDIRIYEKRINETWVLRKFFYATLNHPPGKGCYFDEHEVENIKTGAKIDGRNWEWADVDGRRLVWAEAGKLFASRTEFDGEGEARELYDFNPLTFEAIAAPY